MLPGPRETANISCPNCESDMTVEENTDTESTPSKPSAKERDIPTKNRTRDIREKEESGTSITMPMEAAEEIKTDINLGGEPETSASREQLQGEERRVYYLTDELGRGGMGIVFEGEDPDLHRKLAVKLLRKGEREPPSEKDVLKFLEEAQVQSQLDHPNIPPVYEINTDRKRGLFFVMKKVRGETLRELVEELREHPGGDRAKNMTIPRKLEIFNKICDAISFAHSRGVLHRDLKPENIMVGDFGEVLVMDWGLAKVAGEEDHARGELIISERSREDLDSMSGDLIGTPTYMSPEQARGEPEKMDERSDIYALGGILYALLCHRSPIQGKNLEEMLENARSGHIRRPSDRETDASIPRRLEDVAMTALSADPAERYESVEVLREETTNYLEELREQQIRADAAKDKVKKGRRLLKKYRKMANTIQELERKAENAKKEINTYDPVRVKKKQWELENRLEQKKKERVNLFTRANAAFSGALTDYPESDEAREGKCELFFQRYLEAEEAGEEQEKLLYKNIIEQYDETGEWKDRLDPTGVFSLETHAFTCECLKPFSPGVLEVVSEEDELVPWEDGRAVPGKEEVPEDTLVPRAKLNVHMGSSEGEGQGTADGADRPHDRWGHIEDCPRTSVTGEPVQLYRYVEEDRRNVLVHDREVGSTPIGETELPAGSYLLVIGEENPFESFDNPALVAADDRELVEENRGRTSKESFECVKYPLFVERDTNQDLQIHLYGSEEVPDGFCYVPGGTFLSGDDNGGFSETVSQTRDLFVARRHVTCGEYLEFLNDLGERRPEEARRRQPRSETRAFWVEASSDNRESGRKPEDGSPSEMVSFRMPELEEQKKWRAEAEHDLQVFDWDPDWPVMGISWHDCMAYAAWKSHRDGVYYRLLHELEFEKSGRGTDGRMYPFGNFFDANWANINNSFEEGMFPVKSGEFPEDESPYGIRDLAGNMSTWCWNSPGGTYRNWRALRGGNWYDSSGVAAIPYRRGNDPSHVARYLGMRLAIPVFAPVINGGELENKG